MKKNIVKYSGKIELNGTDIDCFVINDGRRLLSSREMQRVLSMVDEPEIGKGSSGTRLRRYLGQKSLKPFIYKDKELDHFDPIECYLGKQKINGYEAHILIDICDVFLQARKEIILSTRQKTIADQCEILVRSFAKIGLIALIDEATGYQYDRENDELQKILEAYIAEELLPWQKTFPDIFYRELFRLNGWDFTVKGIKKRPGVIGTWTKKLVYEQLPKGVLDELQQNTPKSDSGNKTVRYHQLLTEDIGSSHLKTQINQVITIFQLSDNMKHMWSQFEKLKARQGGQLELPFDFDKKGRTIEPLDESNMSEFDIKLKKALDFNPKTKK